jgi:hypothetical protein
MAIAKLSIDIEARLANFERDLGKVAKASDDLASRMKTSFASVGTAVGAAVGALLAAGAVSQFQGLVNSLDQMNDAAERLGMSTEDLSALAYAAKMSGVEFEDMTAALSKLSVKMQDAASGGKEATSLFKDIGVDVKDASGKLKSADQVMSEVAERFSKLEDGAGKTALAVDLFGKSGAKLVPLLNSGAQGLKDMREEADKLGGILDGKLAKQAADFNDNLDRLAVLSASAGKSIASGLLPWLNEAAESFLIARKHSEGFWDTLNKKIPGLQIIDVANELARVRGEYEQLDFRISNGRAKSGDVEKFAALEKELAYYEELSRAKQKNANPEKATGGDRPIVRTPTGEPKPKKLKANKEVSEASTEATAYAKAMQSLADMTNDAEASQLSLTKSQKALYDLMVSPAWKSMPDAWKETSAAQFKAAYAAETAADHTKRLNELLADTESSGIEKAQSDMRLLITAMEKGIITEEKYAEAIKARFEESKDGAKEAVNELDEFAKSAARNIQDSLADFLFDPFADGVDGMAKKFGQTIQRMAADAAAAQIAKALFGEFGGGKTGDSGLVGAGVSALAGVDWASLFSFDGGGSTGLGARTGGVDGKGGFPAILHPNETVIDHTKGQRAGGTNNITVMVNSQTGDPAEIRRSAAAGARSALGLIGGAKRYA